MTQLIKFASLMGVLGTVWLVILNVFYRPDEFVSDWVLLPLPLHLIIIFGLYSVYTVLYRTLHFNDCPEAAAELTKEIDQARTDLKRKGFKF